jgi:hypothetical protein
LSTIVLAVSASVNYPASNAECCRDDTRDESALAFSERTAYSVLALGGGAVVSDIFFVFGAVAALLLLLSCLVRNPERSSVGNANAAALEETGRRHATYLPVIRQAMASSDFEFLATRAPDRLLRRAQHDRQRIAKLYLADLRTDFEKLLRVARVIAVLSPQVRAAGEVDRLRLSLQFSCRYRLAVLGLYSGPLVLPQVSGLSQMVSELAARIESAMRELGERAALAAELASSLDRRRLDVA